LLSGTTHARSANIAIEHTNAAARTAVVSFLVRSRPRYAMARMAAHAVVSGRVEGIR